MSEYRIMTDATADLPQDMVERLNLRVMPMECSLDGESYLFEPTASQLHPKEFYRRMREGAVTATSQINVFAYTSFFTPLLEAGEDILYIAFSSALTGSQQSAIIAIEELRGKYPDRRIRMVDSMAASMGEGLMVFAAAKKRDEGLSLDDVADWLEEKRQNFSHWFTVDDLVYLKRGGRLTAAAAFLGTALRIKPVLHVDEIGRLTPLSKVQGRKRSLKQLVDCMMDTYLPDTLDVVFISHADCLEDAEYVKDMVAQSTGAKHFVINYIGPIIGAHTGPGAVALFHYGKRR